MPLDLPEARGGLPVPLRISYGGNKVGAAGLGWDVPLSYIFVDTTIAHRRPIGSPNAAPQARERISLVLEGQRIDLLRTSTTANTWLARRNGAQLEVRDRGDGIMFMYDGEGRTYTFSSQGGAAGTRLLGGKLFLLNGISAPGGNSAVFVYQFGAPALPGGGNGLAIDLLHVRFNKSPTNPRCFKNDVLFSYDLPTTAPLSISMLGNTPLVRVRKISKVRVFSRPSCTDPDVVLRTYTFNYQPDPDTQLPRLQSVTMNGQRHTPEEKHHPAGRGVYLRRGHRGCRQVHLPQDEEHPAPDGRRLHRHLRLDWSDRNPKTKLSLRSAHFIFHLAEPHRHQRRRSARPDLPGWAPN